MTRLLSAAALTVVLVFASAHSAAAQGAYVSALLTGDIVRLDHVEGTGRDESGGGEAIGFALRVGTEIGTKWGVELEFARPSEIENEISPGIVPLATGLPQGGTVSAGLGGANIGFPDSIVFPTFSYVLRTKQRNTTLSPAIWVRQELSPKVSLVYIGGAGFRRVTSEMSVRLEPSPLPGIPIAFPTTVTNSTEYDIGPFAGVEGRIGLTDHVQLVTGVRLHGFNGGWLLRPSVGLGWRF
jgi:hypothetical protein